MIYTTSIYLLSDPESGRVRYVGKTVGGVVKRLQHHNRLHDNTRRSTWIKSLKSKGLSPLLTVVEEIVGTSDEGCLAERRWIALLRSDGIALTNHTDGGDGTPGYSPTPEVRALNSAKMKGRKYTPEVLARYRIAFSRPEYRAKLSAAGRGRVFTAESRAKISAALKGRPKTKEHVEKCRLAHIGLKQSEEHRRKTSEALTRSWLPGGKRRVLHEQKYGGRR